MCTMLNTGDRPIPWFSLLIYVCLFVFRPIFCLLDEIVNISGQTLRIMWGLLFSYTFVIVILHIAWWIAKQCSRKLHTKFKFSNSYSTSMINLSSCLQTISVISILPSHGCNSQYFSCFCVGVWESYQHALAALVFSDFRFCGNLWNVRGLI